MTPAGGERLRRSDRLRDRRDFQRVAREGARVSSGSFIVLAARRRNADHEAPPRLGITASRRVGPAVTRNRVKRLVREWFRRNRSSLPRGRDIVVIARPAAREAGKPALDADLAGSTARLQVVLSNVLSNRKRSR